MGTKSPDNMKFLILDDADNMRRSIRAMLKLINYGRNYFEAANGLVAWEFLRKGELPVDFIITEAAEHEVDGYLTKPFVTASLEEKIQELLQQLANPSPVIRHLKRGRDLEAKGELDRAITEVKTALALNQQSSGPSGNRGGCS
jgi:hypothetical protein